MAGLRVELAIASPTGCPVVEAADAAGEPATNATWSDVDDRTIEQFELSVPAADVSADGGTATASSPAQQLSDRDLDVEPVFEHEDGTVYEFERQDGPCACEQIEAAGLPITDVAAEDGTLLVTLHLDDEVELATVLESVRELAEEVSVRSISRSAPDGDETELVLVDRGRLTDRQREVLLTARAMGYYEYPRGANASEVAEALDICPSTLSEHLAAAQTKLLDETFGEVA